MGHASADNSTNTAASTCLYSDCMNGMVRWGSAWYKQLGHSVLSFTDGPNIVTLHGQFVYWLQRQLACMYIAQRQYYC